MARRRSSKMEPEVVSVPAPSTFSDGSPLQSQSLSANSDGLGFETAELAYSYWEARGCTDGSAEEDWFRAEQEMTARHRCRASRGETLPAHNGSQ